MCDYPDEIKDGLAALSADYRDFQENNRGANGYLFFAENNISGQSVALKFYCGEPGERQHDEPRQLAAIHSPNVLPILDARMVSDEWGYFVTPRCHDGDLDDLIETRPSVDCAIDAAIGICRGVSAIHAERMVHRDLKPGNIVFDRGSPRIADFGSVRALNEGQETTQASRHSVLYRPPESFGAGVYGRCGDVYQIGLITYQLLGGTLSYNPEAYLTKRERKEYQEIGDQVERSLYIDGVIGRRACAGNLLDLSTLPPWVSGAARRCLNELTAPDPSKRTSTVSEAVAKLTQVRTSMQDWWWDAGSACVASGQYRIEVRPVGDGSYEAFQVKNGASRRLRGTRKGSLRQVVQQVA
ncbi:protein kinase [Thioalkalivibrio sp. ALE28]|uniref:protein kinase domain-containing protein n=1 Tax=Thioalkalivibrio sp. ALE28 TaxID=1158179 RepID=UPI000476FB1F|nr:protein kinase [Thioalkalivibrio sp. ALE28]